MTVLSDAARRDLAQAMAEAPRRERVATADRLAKFYGISRSTVYAAAKVQGTAKRTRGASRPDYRQWTRTIAALASRPPGLSFEAARRILVAGGALPKEAMDMPIGTAHRLARKMELGARQPRHQRLHADYPMQAVLVDWSASKYLLAERPQGDVDGDIDEAIRQTAGRAPAGG